MTASRFHAGARFVGRLLALSAVVLLAPGAALAAIPTLASLNPNAATAGGAAFTLTLNGSNFDGGSQVLWNGDARATTLVSSTRLTAQVTGADIAVAGSVSVTVVNAGPGGGTSGALSFTITTAQVPRVNGVLPASTAAGSGPFKLTVLGTSFSNGAIVQWGGSDRPTVFFSSLTLEASIEASDIQLPGLVLVTVKSPAPDGFVSNAVPFSILTAAGPPTITGLSPSSAIAGGAEFTLTVTGTGFTNTCVVLWNGSARPTSPVSATTLRATIAAADIETAGTAAVVVRETAPGGVDSAPAAFDVLPFATVYFPQVAVGGGYSTSFTLTNTGAATATGQLILTDQLGNPLTVSMSETGAGAPAGGSATTGSSFPVSVAPGTSVFYEAVATNPASPTRSGWARLESQEGITGTVATFRVMEGAVLRSIAGVLGSVSVEFATIPVDNDNPARRYTGFALANPGSQPLNVSVFLVDRNGAVQSLTPTELNPLGPGHQVARFLHQYVPSLATFEGTMVLVPQGGRKMSVVALVVEQGLLAPVPVIPARPAGVPSTP